MLEKVTTKECLYYLKTYGTFLSLITFYIKHNLLSQAVRMVIEKVTHFHIYNFITKSEIEIRINKKSFLSFTLNLVERLDQLLTLI